MSATLDNAVIVTEDWSIDHLMQNAHTPFESIEELFDLILHKDQSGVVERIILRGKDDNGTDRTMVLSLNYILGG